MLRGASGTSCVNMDRFGSMSFGAPSGPASAAQAGAFRPDPTGTSGQIGTEGTHGRRSRSAGMAIARCCWGTVAVHLRCPA